MADLNLDINYFDHIKTKKLIERLGRGAEVLPLRLWCYTAKHYARDGKLAGHDAGDVEEAIGWWGKPGECVSALVEARFLDSKKSKTPCFAVHNWLKRSGHLAAFAKRARDAANARWERERIARKAHAQALPKQCSSIAKHPPNPTHQPNPPNPPNPTHQPTKPTVPGARAGEGPAGSNGAAGAGGGAARGEAGSGNGMGLGRALGAAFDEVSAGRVLEVQSLLAQVGVGGESQKQLIGRKDITVDRVRAELAKIRSDPKVDNVAAVLVHRLNKRPS